MKIHIVQKGDTLWKIAKKYGVDFEALKKLNQQLKNPDLIMPGMKIKIPTTAVQAKKEAQKMESPMESMESSMESAEIITHKKEIPKKEIPKVKAPKPEVHVPDIKLDEKLIALIRESLPRLIKEFLKELKPEIVNEIKIDLQMANVNQVTSMNMNEVSVKQPVPIVKVEPMLPSPPQIPKAYPLPEMPKKPLTHPCPPFPPSHYHQHMGYAGMGHGMGNGYMTMSPSYTGHHPYSMPHSTAAMSGMTMPMMPPMPDMSHYMSRSLPPSGGGYTGAEMHRHVGESFHPVGFAPREAQSKDKEKEENPSTHPNKH